jgi:hypothetical protein
VNHVSFRGEFSKEHSPEVPAGKDLSGFLKELFELSSITILREGCTDFSWWIDIRYSGVVYEFEFGAVEEKYADWLLYIERKNPLYRMLFLSSTIDSTLLSLVHNLFDSTEKICEIR